MNPDGFAAALIQLQRQLAELSAQLDQSNEQLLKAEAEIEGARWDFEAPLLLDLNGAMQTHGDIS